MNDLEKSLIVAFHATDTYNNTHGGSMQRQNGTVSFALEGFDMRLVSFTCPGCGAQLEVDVDSKRATCPYCSKTLPVDDEVRYVKLDGAAQAGYEFEKGRQQAQAEFAQQQPQAVYANVQPAEPPKKRRTWLWVLGWICIFPVPLTILMLKNEKMNKRVRFAIIAVGWLVYLAIAFGSGAGGNKEKKDADTGSISAAVTAVQSSSTASESASASAEASGPTKDGVVNEFIESYNAISASPIESTEQGNIATKYFAYSYGYYLELLHANDTGKISVTINETNENAEVGVPGMRDVFHDACKAIDPTISDDDIYGYFDRACDDPSSRGDQTIGTIALFWSPDVDSSSGHSRGYIRLSAQ